MSQPRIKTLVLATVIAFLASGALWAQTEEAAAILEKASGGVLPLVVYGADNSEIPPLGTALAVGEDLVAAPYHLVCKASSIDVITAKGKKIKVEGIAAVDKAHDIVLLRLKGKVQPLTMSVTGPESMAAGARLFAMGANESRQVIVSEGTFRRMVAIGPNEKVMDVSASVVEQFSGGPIMNIDGQVVGMTIVVARGVKAGLPASVLQAVTRTGKLVDIKSAPKEDYFATLEGSSLAGLMAAAMDEAGTARSFLEKAAGLAPASVGIWEALAGVCDKQRDFSAALDAYRKVTELDASRAAAYYSMGSILAKMTKYPEAVTAFEKAIALNIDTKEIYFELGSTYEAVQDWAKAAAAYEKYISLKPEVTWNSYLRLGFCRLSLKEFDAAIAALLEAQKAQPKDLKVNFSLADAYEKAGKLDKAEETYYQLAAINPPEAKAYYSQALRMYNAAGQYDKAIAPAKKIVDLNPKSENDVYYLALMYFQQKNYPDAITVFKQCLDINPDHALAWFQIGGSYFNQKMYKEAIEAYKKFVAASPNEPNGWLSLGVSYMFLKPPNFESALEPMKKAVDLNPQNMSAQYNLALVYVGLNDFLSARDIQKKIAGVDPALAQKLGKYIR